MGYPKEEPPAELRNAAKIMRQMFVALVNENFTESQALQIIGISMMAGGQGGQMNNGD